MSLVDLKTFVAAARSGSFAAAARQLGVSPALVGRRVQALERRHGVRLIERTTRAQRLTETGEAFLGRAEAVLDASAALDELTRGGTGALSGRVRISGPTTLGDIRLAQIVAAFCTAHPGVTVELVLSNHRVDLINDGFDLAVRIGILPPSSLIARRVGTYGFTACAAPAYLSANGTPATPAALSAARCILNLNIVPRGQWRFYGPGGEAVSVEVSGNLQIDQDEAQRSAALAGAGIAYLPTELVRGDLAAGRLLPVLGHWQTLTLPIQLVHPSRLVSRRLTAIMDAIADGLRETQP